ncbi:MAG: hypothetical protein M1831_005975 [Alyxoria varia]|nr:MAG: hypothetical protein M1831_005975 [Alyxoria varia]
MALNIGYGIGYFFVALYQCGDPSQFAIRHILGGCLSTQVINGCAYTHSVINALSDAILVLLPIHAVWKSNMSNRSKWSVAAIIGIASIGVVCTIIRIGYVYKLSASSEDYYVMIKPMVLLSGAELSIGITCVSLCTYRPLFSWLFGKDENYYYPNDEESNAQEKSRGTLDSSQVHFDSYRSSRTLQDFEGGSGAVSQILKDVPHVRSEHQPQIEEKPEEESEPSTGWQSPNPSEANNGIPTVATSRDLSS